MAVQAKITKKITNPKKQPASQPSLVETGDTIQTPSKKTDPKKPSFLESPIADS